MVEHQGLHIPIGPDGGVSTETARDIVNVGASVLIAGSSVYNSRCMVEENVDALLKSVN